MLLDAWRLALGTLTAVRVPPPEQVDRRVAGMAMVLAPLAAVPLGAAVTLVGLLGHWLDLSVWVTALLAVGALVLGNRAFHLDGLSDTVDGLASSFDAERSLAVMKTGTSGPAGVAATVLVIGLQTAGLAALFGRADWWQAAILGGVAVCVSRAALVICCARGVRPAREDGLGRTFTQTVPRSVAAISWLLVTVVLAAVGAWAGFPWWRGVFTAVLALVAVGVIVSRAVRRFGGVTGDVFGAAVELALVAILVGLS
ncbi:adenosylcobinamide-GDP ribazoletransferase [Flexivirga endophytica]|uniref:Adenosylcobinamide-GDP ribazoletransferase n=1 Tax=Flexivirga endophytica TaxID=1849103 RepID=A0A916SYI6_9MICO|nr:adenosylcobinamide-GDP ribazoletransferase [Flexivirga endophytica]GGB23526.1 adenosylcobinamide-GDP ribazoletransferase [Flexivirga endophytica]GHB57470.1 adenosylcobinamide-GDP ribazoletransferase [Flexivirga endophytica]